MKLRVLSTIALQLLMGACAEPPAPNYQAPAPNYQAPIYYPPPTPTFSANAASRLLKQGMTEEEVVRVLGAQPVRTGLETCGSKTREPWRCKKMHYRDSPYGYGSLDLVILFEEDSKGVWFVTAWTVL